MEDYFAVRGNITGADLGRYNITRREEDRYLFKVPSLRNVALTAPYLHDGSANSLRDVVAIMARYQLALKLDAADIDRIVAFLRTLTGEYQGRLLE
jgi:cytochrome c peroxidase